MPLYAVPMLWERFGHLIQEIGKFGVVGGVAFVVDFAIYAFCLQGLGIETLTAKAIAASVAATLAFFGNRFWTWRHRERSGSPGSTASTSSSIWSELVWRSAHSRRPITGSARSGRSSAARSPTTSLPSSWARRSGHSCASGHTGRSFSQP